MSQSETVSSKAKSIRQKRVLELAEKKPNASLSEISEEIPSATTDYVDRILDRFGDPAASSEADPDDSQPEDTGAEPAEEDESQSENTNKENMSKETPPTSPPTIPGTDSTNDPNQTDDTRESEEPSIVDNTRGSQEESDEEAPDPDDLTQKERETLRAIHYEPTAAQKEIANMLGVSRATVSNRVNAISGFSWQNRGSFVEEMFDEDIIIDDSIIDGANQSSTDEIDSSSNNQSSSIPDTSNSMASKVVSKESEDGDMDAKTGAINQTTDDSVDPEVSGNIAEMANQMNEIERCLDELEANIKNTDSQSGSLLDDSELLHKVVHACMDADIISEEEELKILEAITD